MNLRHFRATFRPGRGQHDIVIVRAGRDDAIVVEVVESPSRRSVQVHVNGQRVHP